MGTYGREVCIRFHSKEECVQNFSRYYNPLRVQARADCICLIGNFRAGYDMGDHKRKLKIGGGRGQNPYLGHTGWYRQRGGHRSHGQGSQLGNGYDHYNNCGQGRGRGGHGSGNVRQDGGHSGNGGARGVQG